MENKPVDSQSTTRDRLEEWGGTLTLTFGLYLLVYLVWLMLQRDESPAIVNAVSYLLFRLVTVAAAWRVSAHPALNKRGRRGWKLIALAFLCLLIDDASRLSNELMGGANPLTSSTALLSLSFYFVLFAGLLFLSSPLRNREERLRYWLDLGIVMVGGGTVLWFFVVSPTSIVTGSSHFATALSLARPVGDLAILFGSTTLLLAGEGGGSRRVYGLLTAGILLFFAADLSYGHLSLLNIYRPGGWVDGLWMVAGYLVLVSSHCQFRELSRPRQPESSTPGHTRRGMSMLPYLFVAAGYALLIFVTYRNWSNPFGGLVVGAVALTAMVTVRQIASVREQARVQQRFRSLVQHSSDIVTIINRNLSVVYESPSVSRVLGYEAEQLLGTDFTHMLHPEDRTRAVALFSDLLKQPNDAVNIEWRFGHRDGSWLHAESVCTNLINDDAVRGMVVNTRDVTARKQAEERLQHDAFHDALTGLPNRALFKEHLRVAIGRVRRSPHYMYAVLFLDLDRFKNVNDSLGHSFGDRLLIAISERLQNSVRLVDVVARLGGDEFAVLLDGIEDANDAVHVAGRVQKSLQDPIEIGDRHEMFATTSIGIALSNAEYLEPEDVLRDADTAMYRAKARGRACHEVFDKFMHARAVALLQLENDLRRAVEREEFEVYYQPIVSLGEGEQISGFEALVRWHHPERGLVAPADFISVAEDTGLIIHIGKWVLREACKQMRQWQSQYSASYPLILSVNLSGKQFMQADLVEQIQEVLAETGFDPHCLQLEITESVVIENTEIVTSMLMRIRELGIQLTMDDFGTGYSSLSYLHMFPIDVLKIDRSFISQAGGAVRSEIVPTIIMLARNMGMKVVAEGVETDDQLAHLHELDCAYGQGYLFSHPVDARSAGELLSNGLAVRGDGIVEAA